MRLVIDPALIITRNDTAANWTARNDTLMLGEKALENDTGREKIGDGVTAWNSLAYRGKRVATVASSATPSINTDVTDIASITALAVAITSMTTNLTGAPVDGSMLTIRITDNGTARAITWGARFEASTVSLPTTTVVSAMLFLQFMWNTATSKWRLILKA